MKDKKYYVIGGQYEPICYGGSDTLRGARWISTHNEEYWDNWQGWHKPNIYAAEDTRLVEAKDRVTYFDGEIMRVPCEGAEPI